MKTKIIRQFIALFLVVVLETESFLCNNIMVQAQTNDVPFKLENTTYGIKNSNIKAIKLTVTSDNTEEILDWVCQELTFLQENLENNRKRIYVIGVNGLLCSYETTHEFNKNNVQRIGSYYDSDDSDVFYAITNPETNKKDLINVTKGELYELAASSIRGITVTKDNANAFTSEKNKKILGFIVYDENGGKILNCEAGKIIDLKDQDSPLVYCDKATETYVVEDENELYLCSNKKTIRHLESEDGGGVQLVCSPNNDGGRDWACYDGWWAVLFYKKGVKGEKIAWLNAKDGSLNYTLSAVDTEKEWGNYYIASITESGIYVSEDVYDNDNNTLEENLYYVNEKGKTKLPYKSVSDVVKLKDGIAFWGCESGGTQEKRYVLEKEKQKYKTDIYRLYFWKGNYGIVSKNVMGDGPYYLVDAMGNEIKKLEDEWIPYVSLSDNRDHFDIVCDRFLETGGIVYDIKKDKIWDCLKVKKAGDSYLGYGKKTNRNLEIINLDTEKKLTGNVRNVYEKDDIAVILCSDGSDYFIINTDMDIIAEDVYDFAKTGVYTTEDGIYNIKGERLLDESVCGYSCWWWNASVYETGIFVVRKKKDDDYVYNGSDYVYNYCSQNGDIILDEWMDYVDFDSKIGKVLVGNQAAVVSRSGLELISAQVNGHSESGMYYSYANKARVGATVAIFQTTENEYYIYNLEPLLKKIDSGEVSENQLQHDVDMTNAYKELKDNAFKYEDVKLNGLKTSFTLPDSIPVIGGGEVALDFGMVPVKMEMSGDMIRAGIGVDLKNSDTSLFDLEQEEWNTFKKAVEKHDESIKNGSSLLKLAEKKGYASMPARKNIKASVYGFVEGVMNEDHQKMKSVSGQINVQLSFKTEKKWQVAVVEIPVVISAELELSSAQKINLGLDFSNDTVSVYSNGTWDIVLPKVTLSGGVGVAYICDVSCYGSFSNTVSLESDSRNEEDQVVVRDYVEGEAGVSASLLGNIYRKPLWKSGKKIVYSSDGKEMTSRITKESTKIRECDFVKQKTSSGDIWDGVLKKETENKYVGVLEENAYEDSNTKIVATDNGTKLMLFNSLDASRTVGNQSVLMYSLYDKNSDSWMQPKIVDDDHTADYYFDAVVCGKDIYIAWTNSSKEEKSDSSISEIAKKCEIAVTKFDTDKNEFSSTTVLTENNYADVKPSLAVDGNTVYAAWLTNSEGDLINLSGKNGVHYATCLNDVWQEESVLIESNSLVIISAQIGKVSDEICLAYITDKDGNAETGTDGILNLLNIQGGESTVVDKDSDNISNVSFVNIEGKNVIAYSSSKGYGYTDTDNYISLFEDTTGYTDFQIVSGGEKKLVIAKKSVQTGTHLYAAILKDGKMSTPVPITEQTGYVGAVSGIGTDNGYYFVYVKKKCDISKDNIEVMSKICGVRFNAYTKTEVEFQDNEDIMASPGEKTEIMVALRNKGLNAIQSGKVQILLDGEMIGEKEIANIINSGDEANLPVTVKYPKQIEKGGKLECKYINQLNNSESSAGELKIGQSELELSAIKKNNYVVIYVKNNSAFKTNAKMDIYENNSDGKKLYSIDIDNITAGEIKRIVISKSKFEKQLVEDDSNLYIAVKGDDNEKYLSDNYVFVPLYYESRNNDTDDDDKIDDDYYDDSKSNTSNTKKDNVVDNNVTNNKTSSFNATNKSSVKRINKSVGKVKGIKIKKYKLQKSKVSVKVSWKKNSKVSGYQLQYAENKLFKKKRKTKSCSAKKHSIIIKGLKKGKKYYIRIRAYKNIKKKKVYGKWSAKKVVIKK